MNYADSTTSLARELVNLRVTQNSMLLDGDGLDLALTGRNSAMTFARRALEAATDRRLSAPEPGDRAARVDAVAAEPVLYLHREVAATETPARPDKSLSDWGIDPPASGPQRAWYDVARHAQLAGADLDRISHRLDDQQKWTVAADAAAIARTVHELDRHLISAANGSSPDLAARLEAIRRPILPIAAQETLTVASQGPLPSLDVRRDLSPNARPATRAGETRPIYVNSPGTLAEAQSRLVAQIATPHEISPQSVGTIARGQHALLAAATKELADVDPGRAAAAAKLHQALDGVPVHPRDVTTLDLGDRRAKAQTDQMWRYIGYNRPSSSDPTAQQQFRKALALCVDRAPRVVTTLSDQADRQLNDRWVVSYAGEDQRGLAWGPWNAKLDRPRLNNQLHQAADVALVQAVTSPHARASDAQRGRHAHEVLDGLPRTGQRPERPTDRTSDTSR